MTVLLSTPRIIAAGVGSACLLLLAWGLWLEIGSAYVAGDADCDGDADSVDAALVLQRVVGLLESLDCHEQADTDGDRRHTSRDAQLILQYVAGLYPQLADQGPWPTFTPTITSTPRPPTATPTITATPTPITTGVSFSMAADVNGDGLDDCGTGEGMRTGCLVVAGTSFTVKINLDSLPPAVPNYGGFDVAVRLQGLTLDDLPSAAAWPDCVFEAYASLPEGFAIGCAIGVVEDVRGLAPLSTYTGVIVTATFTASCGSGISLLHGHGNTSITYFDAASIQVYYEATDGEESLQIVCLE